MNPFASHVIRALLLLLSPNLVTSHETAQHAMRSKKSAAWKARQGPLKSVFNESDSREDLGSNNPPEIFSNAARKFVEVVRQELDGNETRALAADKVASPTLQVSNLRLLPQQSTEQIF
jgi:nucleolar protein 9